MYSLINGHGYDFGKKNPLNLIQNNKCHEYFNIYDILFLRPLTLRLN